jgi:hypothetical protein
MFDEERDFEDEGSGSEGDHDDGPSADEIQDARNDGYEDGSKAAENDNGTAAESILGQMLDGPFWNEPDDPELAAAYREGWESGYSDNRDGT